MRDEINQNISRLIDGDLGYDETLGLLKKIKSDKELKAKMDRYQTISLALKTEEVIQIRPDFASKISQAIQQEPAYLLPQRKPDKPHNKKIFAVAASSLVAAVLVGYQIRHNSPSFDRQQTSATFAASTQPSRSVVTAQSEKEMQRPNHPRTAQFNDYLQAHNSSVYTVGEANFHPYAKTASYGR